MSDNVQSKESGDPFNKWMNLLKNVTLLFGLVTSIFASTFYFVEKLIENVDDVRSVTKSIRRLIDNWDTQKKTVAVTRRKTKTKISDAAYKSPSNQAKRRSKKAIIPKNVVPEINNAFPQVTLTSKTIILHSGDDKEHVLQENQYKDSLWVTDIELLHELVSTKVLNPEAVIDRTYEYYYERKIRWSEEFFRLASRSGMSYQVMRAYNPKLDFNNNRSIKAGITSIILKAKTIHQVKETDTLESISVEYNIPLEAILRANCIEKDWIFTGRRLYIPYPNV